MAKTTNINLALEALFEFDQLVRSISSINLEALFGFDQLVRPDLFGFDQLVRPERPRYIA